MGISSNHGLKKKRTKAEVAKTLRLDEREFKEFEKEGLFAYGDRSKKWIDAINFERLRVAVELRREFGVNLPGIDVILAMREKMTKMKQEMNKFLSEVREGLGDQVEENLGAIASKTKKSSRKKG